MNNIAIKVNHLTKIYKLYDKPIDRLKESLHPLKKQYHKDFYALSDVNFEIKKGETVGIIGKNGAGKSTLLKIITGVLTPTNGSVHVNGRIASLLELGAGFNPEYTGIENIYFQGSLMGYAHEEMEAKVDDIVKFADIGDFVHQPVKMYSSGMFARLAFAVAINVDPDILIVDEALSVGDAAFQRKCFARMETIRNNGTTIVFVSHSEGQIVELCSRAIFIHSGQIVLDGNPKRVTSLYAKMMNSDTIDIVAIQEEFLHPQQTKAQDKTIKSTDEVQSDTEDDDFEEYFDASLRIKSPIEYNSNGAKISDVRILTLEGKEVNVLCHKKNYIYSYKVEFFQDFYSVDFGMMFKSMTGIELGATSSHYKKEKIEKVKKGEIYFLNYIFKNIFLPGVYFTNAGCQSYDSSTYGMITRLLDCYCFKVAEPKHTKEYGGYISFVTQIHLTCE